MKRIILITMIFSLQYSIAICGDNVCTINKLEALGSNHFSLDVSVINDDTIAGFQIPLKFYPEDCIISVDSINLENSRGTVFQLLDADINPNGDIAYIYGNYTISDDEHYSPLDEGEGLIGKIFLTCSSLGDNPILKIGQNEFINGEVKFNYSFWSVNTQEIKCRFETKSFKIPIEE